jgi:hypothetical protein
MVQTVGVLLLKGTGELRVVGPLPPGFKLPVSCYTDTKLATDNYRAHTKHIDICYHFVRQVIGMGEITDRCDMSNPVTWYVNVDMGLNKEIGGRLKWANCVRIREQARAKHTLTASKTTTQLMTM